MWIPLVVLFIGLVSAVGGVVSILSANHAPGLVTVCPETSGSAAGFDSRRGRP